MKYGLIGLGNLGNNIATNLIKSDFGLYVHDLDIDGDACIFSHKADKIVSYDHYTDMASALQALSPMDYDTSILSKSKMAEYDPDGFRHRVLLELLQFLP